MTQTGKSSSSSLLMAVVGIGAVAAGAFWYMNSNKPTVSPATQPLPKAASVEEVSWDKLYANFIDNASAKLVQNLKLITQNKSVEGRYALDMD